VRRRSDEFDELYWSLLGVLHESFNGQPGKLTQAIELMFGLEIAAKRLVQMPVDQDSPYTAGPAFRDRRGLAAWAQAPAAAAAGGRIKPLTQKGQPEPA
jgi:hypothetical protein